jgi:hypothetical protein
MEIGKRTFEEIRSVCGSLIVTASPASLLALRTAVLRAEVAGRGWNKEKGRSENPLVYIIVRLWGISLLYLCGCLLPCLFIYCLPVA